MVFFTSSGPAILFLFPLRTGVLLGELELMEIPHWLTQQGQSPCEDHGHKHGAHHQLAQI
jgi:hypothetical protein